MKDLRTILEGILDPNLDVTEEDLDIVLSKLDKLKFRSTIEGTEYETPFSRKKVTFDDKLLKDLKDSVRPGLPISAAVEKYLPREYRKGKKYEVMGQIIHWILCQKLTDPYRLDTLGNPETQERWKKEVLSKYASDWHVVANMRREWYLVRLIRVGDLEFAAYIMEFTLK